MQRCCSLSATVTRTNHTNSLAVPWVQTLVKLLCITSLTRMTPWPPPKRDYFQTTTLSFTHQHASYTQHIIILHLSQEPQSTHWGQSYRVSLHIEFPLLISGLFCSLNKGCHHSSSQILCDNCKQQISSDKYRFRSTTILQQNRPSCTGSTNRTFE